MIAEEKGHRKWPAFAIIPVLSLTLVCANPGGSLQPARRGDGLDALVGEAVDLAGSAISYRADRRQGGNPTETQWMTSGEDGTLCGLMWEEMRYLTEVKLHWSEGTEDIPAADDLLLETWGMNTSYHSPPDPGRVTGGW